MNISVTSQWGNKPFELVPFFSPAIFAKALMRTQTCPERFDYKWYRFKCNNCLFFYFSCTLYLHLVFYPFEDRLYFRKVSFSRACLKPWYTSDCALKVHCQRWSARAESGTSQLHFHNRDVVSTGPLARGHLIFPPGHLLLGSTGPDWPPMFKA